jgi:hypothetical protein
VPTIKSTSGNSQVTGLFKKQMVRLLDRIEELEEELGSKTMESAMRIVQEASESSVQIIEEASHKIPPGPFVAGSAWFIRTVTYHLVGVVTGRWEHFITLKDASWVADSGRFTQAIKEGKLSEVEPVGAAVVNLDSIVDAFPWVHPLPTKQK